MSYISGIAAIPSGMSTPTCLRPEPGGIASRLGFGFQGMAANPVSSAGNQLDNLNDHPEVQRLSACRF